MRRIALLLVALLPLSLSAQQAKRPAVLYGSVLSDPNDHPVSGAEVIVAPTLSARTDSAGDFVIRNVPAGVYQVVVRHVGNPPLTALLAFAPGDSVGRDFVLAREATQLDTVHVVEAAVPNLRLGKMMGFAERQKNGFGTFFDAAIIEKQHDRRLSDIIQSRAQVRVMPLGSGAAIASRRGISLNGPSGDGTDRRRGARPACYSQVFIDGLRVYYPATDKALFDINSIQPDQLQGIEYYAGGATTPTEYSGLGANCGTLLLWTK